MSVQSVIFDRKIFTLQQATKWIVAHGFKTRYRNKAVDVKPHTYRFRQKQPSKKYKYRTLNITDGIKFIVRFK